MDNIVKLPAQQATFNATNRLVDLIVPSNSGVYNLAETYVAIQCRIDGIELNTTEAAAGQLAQAGDFLAATEAVADIRLNIKHHATVATIYDSCAVPLECLVKNCSMTSSTRGKIEDIRRSDTLRGTMKCYTQDKEDVEGRSITGFAGMAKSNPFVSGRFASLVAVGSTASTYQTHELRIMLKDLFDICGFADAWDTADGAYGDLRLHMELSLDRLQLQQYYDADALFSRPYHNHTAGAISGPADKLYKEASQVTVAIGAGEESDTIEMAAQYASLDDSPFFNNMMVAVTTNYSGGATAAAKYPADAEVRWGVIKSIAWDKTSKRVTLDFGAGSNIFSSGVVTVAALVVDREVVGINATSLANKLSFPSVELTAVRRVDVTSGPSQIQYTQMQTQSDQWSNASSLERSYYVPAQTTNAFIVLPSASGLGFSDILGCARVGDYRLTLDGVSVTNRAVPFMPVPGVNQAANDAKCDRGSSLHYTLISEAFMNSGKRFSSLEESVYDQNIPFSIDQPFAGGSYGWLTLAAAPQKAAYMLALPIPISTTPTQLTISLNGNFPNSSGELHIFSEVRSLI
jgi:hypothetical protein